jgi:hypothetical protein
VEEEKGPRGPDGWGPRAIEKAGGNGREGPSRPVSGLTARVIVFFLSFSFLF